VTKLFTVCDEIYSVVICSVQVKTWYSEQRYELNGKEVSVYLLTYLV